VNYFCCDERRRNDVKAQALLNGIEFLEVSDDTAAPAESRQRTLFVHFIHPVQSGALSQENVRIEGGERISNIIVTAANIGPVGSPPSSVDDVLVVQVSHPGDFSTYTLRLVADSEDRDPPPGFDPILSTVDFSFKVACLTDFDCAPAATCATPPGPQPDINYLAKDYASFRQLMLDRMALLMPQWQERNAADVGIALVELLAYAGDRLSYQQDAVATESYLGTARLRTSVRRHARMVDYFMHDGGNARAWVQVRAAKGAAHVHVKAAYDNRPTKLLTRLEGRPPVMQLESAAYQKALAGDPQIFELMHDLDVFEAHNEMKLYTWGARECCLPRGATHATLAGAYSRLAPGDVLVFVEVRGPETGEQDDADPTHRHAVRVTKVTHANDPLYAAEPPLASPPLASAPASPPAAVFPVTQIEWHHADALPFPLCISARRGSKYYDDVSVVLGNIALADHGHTVEHEALEPVPDFNKALTKASPKQADRCNEPVVELTAPRFRPPLKRSPLTHAAPYVVHEPPESAAATMRWTTNALLPAITLTAPSVSADVWRAKRDLFSSHSNDREFVVESETDGTAYLRFGDGQFGTRPAPGTVFTASYRVGTGVAGNVGADAIAHLVSHDPAIGGEQIAGVCNPLAAQGGIDPETMEQVRQNAPDAFRTQERAVTPDDYALSARRCGTDVQRAAATFRWTGSWRTVFLTVDRFGGRQVDQPFEDDVRRCMERYRMAGHDLEVDGPLYVALEIAMTVCVKRGYLVSEVKAALRTVFSNRLSAGGKRGLFHPDSFTFGQPVFLSTFYAAAQAVDGVDSVEITTFQRQGIPSGEALASGRLALGRLEIARLDNDPDFPERGVFHLIMRGGR
jgi:hypothetical protein